jgi:ribonuclease Y
MSDPVVLAVVALIAIAAGIGIGFVARSMVASQAIRAAQDKTDRILAEARAQQKELILQAKDEQMKMARQSDEDARAKRQELSNLERRILQRDEQLDQRADMLEERDRKLISRERELDQSKEELAQARQEQIVALEKVSHLSQDEAKQVLIEQVRAEAEQDAVGAWILAELESERRWDDLLARSSDLLSELAAEAVREDEAGLTEPLDPDRF